MKTQESLMKGYPPETSIGAGNPEVLKYGRLWETKEYRMVSPGEIFIPHFLRQAGIKSDAHVIDFGCGTGRAGAKLNEMGMKVSMLDFARNCLDEKVKEGLSDTLTFKKHDLCTPSPVVAGYGYCTDVMEHIPPEKVNDVLDNILRAAKHVFFAICTKRDELGELIGENLHLSVHPYEWWLEKFKEFSCVILWSDKVGAYAFFYVTVWEDAQVVVENGKLNVTEELIRSNVEHNCKKGWQQVSPHPTQETEVMIVGSGPSLKDFEDDIRAKRAAGVKLVTLNGAYNWALDRGLIPSATVVVDARESNARFTHPPVVDCKYLLASQCHPSVFEGLPKDRTYLWHTMGDVATDIINEHYPVNWQIPGGSTVFLRAVPLLRTLGFRKFHVYGCDSCLSDGKHQAISQPENDGQVVVPMIVEGGKVFYCHPWMASQAREFITLIQKLGAEFDMIVYGNGLLAHILETGASLTPAQEA